MDIGKAFVREIIIPIDCGTVKTLEKTKPYHERPSVSYSLANNNTSIKSKGKWFQQLKSNQWLDKNLQICKHKYDLKKTRDIIEENMMKNARSGSLHTTSPC